MAAVDYFLLFKGIEGESHDHKMKAKGAIDLESWSWGESQTGTGHTAGGHGAGKVHMQDFHFVTKFGKHSPKLFLACADGEHMKEALLICRKAGKDQQEYLHVKMTDLLVSSYQTGGSAHGDLIPTDQCSINFARIEFEYKEQKQDGSLGAATKAGYDVKQQKHI